MVLGRLRNLVNRLAPSIIGRALARAGVKADHITYIGLAVAALAPVAAWLRAIWALPVIIIISGVMDVIDGAVARASGTARPFGSFIDSMSDRVEDFLYFLALAIAGINALIALAAAAFSLMVSYARSKGELLGVKMEGVGLLERSERVLVLFLVAILVALGLRLVGNIVVAIVAALGVVTVVQRSLTVKKALEGPAGQST